TTTTIPSPTSEELPASSVAPEPTPSAPTMLAEEPEEAPVVIGGDLEVVVERGDHMWGLAKARLAVLLGRPPTDSEIAPYWQRVVEVNRDRIRSGDPDLIFPGEVLVLPKP
ncbi:MAG: hypothetical protein Q8Q52_00585, partial [Acidimicrobiia bacterium]|nr:hypothetical protein [Acidimicrobiia bacterium]